MEKFGPPRNQTNDTSFERSRQGLFKNVFVFEIEAILQKLWPFMWKNYEKVIKSHGQRFKRSVSHSK